MKNNKGQSSLSSKDITCIAIFVSLISVCSFITIPLQVPITMQSFAVMISAAMLGRRRGVIAILIYILLGLIGVPIFAGFSSGVAAIMGPAGGYIIGFVFMAYIIGAFAERAEGEKFILAASMVLGTIVCYIFGCFWFLAIYSKGTINVWACLSLCVIPFIITDIVKILLAVFIVDRLSQNIFFKQLTRH